MGRSYNSCFICIGNVFAVVSTLLNFVRMFRRAHEENCKQLEIDKKKLQKEVENGKANLNATERDSGKPDIIN